MSDTTGTQGPAGGASATSGSAALAESRSPQLTYALDLLGRFRRSAIIAFVISPAGILIIAAARLLIVSDYNTTTAAAIVTSSGYVNTLLGSVLPVIQVFMPYAALILMFSRRLMLSILAFLAAALVSPTAHGRHADAILARSDLSSIGHWMNSYWWVYFFVAIAAVLLIVELIGFGPSNFLRSLGVVISLAIVLYAVRIYPFPLTDSYYSSLVRQPWLPAETITMKSGRQVVGYNLASGGTWIEVLLAKERTIKFFADDNVVQQRLCQLEASQVSVPIISFSPAIASLPLCPQAANTGTGDGGTLKEAADESETSRSGQ
jgi:hypothetical protein